MEGWPIAAVAWATPFAVAGGWLMVRAARASVWLLMGATLGLLGLLAAATGELRASGDVSTAVAVVAGLGSGLGLYVATAVFMHAARRWGALASQAAALYARRGGLSLASSLVVAAAISSPGEELAWRGAVQGALSVRLGGFEAALLAWGVYLVANAVSGSLPIILGSFVAGAAWGGLALWTGGVVAGIACHVVWTGLMLARPPLFSAEGRRTSGEPVEERPP